MQEILKIEKFQKFRELCINTPHNENRNGRKKFRPPRFQIEVSAYFDRLQDDLRLRPVAVSTGNDGWHNSAII